MIQNISQNDIPACVHVIREAFLTVANEFGFTADNAPRFTAFAMNEERLAWQYEQEHRPMYAYYDADKIIGYYSLALQDNGECELNNVAVLPSYRHRGIGGKLLLHAFEQAEKRGCAIMKIGIVEENTVLRKWYESYGFIHIGTEKFDFFPFTCGYMEKTLRSLCYCGHDCSGCVTYLATTNNDDALREQSRRFYKEEFGLDIPLGQINCRGGRTDRVLALCRSCPFRKCCKQHHVEACSLCPEYPCNLIADYRKKYVNQCNQI